MTLRNVCTRETFPSYRAALLTAKAVSRRAGIMIVVRTIHGWHIRDSYPEFDGREVVCGICDGGEVIEDIYAAQDAQRLEEIQIQYDAANEAERFQMA